jgi:hypothetical protein
MQRSSFEKAETLPKVGLSLKQRPVLRHFGRLHLHDISEAWIRPYDPAMVESVYSLEQGRTLKSASTKHSLHSNSGCFYCLSEANHEEIDFR